MTTREGNLQAPTRHALDWRNPEFYAEAALMKEMERVFDICHGCRRCVSLCQSFPTLFDLVDESKTMEVDGVAKADYWKVVDQCYLCDVCYMTKCPYVPPHPWNLDFPHLMLRAKAVTSERPARGFATGCSPAPTALGKLATIPVVVQTVNKVQQHAVGARRDGEGAGCRDEARLPPYDGARFRETAGTSVAWPVRDGAAHARQGGDLLDVLRQLQRAGDRPRSLGILAHNEVPFRIVDKEACCGMPKLELGDLETVEKLKNVNIPALAALARDGYAILTPVPSCTLMFKQELPLIFPDDDDVKAVADAMFDPFEYLVLRDRDGLLKKDFRRPLGKVSYHIPCHSRVQNVGQKTREVLEWVPGDHGHHRRALRRPRRNLRREIASSMPQSMKIGRPVFGQMAQAEPDYISSDCPIAGRRILQGIEESGAPHRGKKEHPLTLVRIAYGL